MPGLGSWRGEAVSVLTFNSWFSMLPEALDSTNEVIFKGTISIPACPDLQKKRKQCVCKTFVVPSATKDVLA